MHARRKTSDGFTLIELMAVVAILGILAATAYPLMMGYVYKSKTMEAVGFLAEIKARQESYKSDFGQYCAVSTSDTDWSPTETPGNKYMRWPNDPAWRMLGVQPPGNQVMFRYVTVSGFPGTVPGWGGGLGYTGEDFWFVSRAQADLDGDREVFEMESYSHSTQLWMSNSTGWD